MTPETEPPVINRSQPLRVRYSLARWDLLRWQFYLLVRNRVLIGFGLIVSLGLVWSELRAPELSARSIGFKIFFSVFFIAAMLCIYGFVTMVLLASMALFKKYRGLLGEHELEIREDGLFERTDVNESIHRWPGFHKIVTTRRYLYIYVTDNNVHIVPLRFFASEQEQRAFHDEIWRHLRAN